MYLTTKEAIANRILELCNKRSLTINSLANSSGVPPMTIYSMLDSRSENPGIITIKKLCDGINIDLPDFFNTDSFRNLEQEIK